jgi:uncharacterized integral membrane protein
VDDERRPGEYRKEGPSGKLIGAGIGLVLLLIFVLQNTDRADVDFLFLDVTVRIWSVILISAALGFVVGWALGRARRGRRNDD